MARPTQGARRPSAPASGGASGPTDVAEVVITSGSVVLRTAFGDVPPSVVEGGAGLAIFTGDDEITSPGGHVAPSSGDAFAWDIETVGAIDVTALTARALAEFRYGTLPEDFRLAICLAELSGGSIDWTTARGGGFGSNNVTPGTPRAIAVNADAFSVSTVVAGATAALGHIWAGESRWGRANAYVANAGSPVNAAANGVTTRSSPVHLVLVVAKVSAGAGVASGVGAKVTAGSAYS